MASKPAKPTNWRYSGPPRLYMSIPVTVEHGDVIAHPNIPAQDGCWEPTPDPATKGPDNEETR